MKLLYDLSYTQDTVFYSGLYEYGKKIFNELINLDNVTVLLLKNKKIDDWIINSNCKIEYINSKKNSKKYWNEIYEILKSYDRVYFPYQLAKKKIRIPKNCELIFTIHDLAQIELAKFGKINKYEALYYSGKKKFIEYPIKQLLRITGIWQAYLKHNLRKNIKASSRIITISEYSKEQIKRYFKTDDSKIMVCYSPLKLLSSNNISNFNYKNYFLFVSASRYTKNTYRGLKALDLIWDENKDFPIAIVTGKLPDTILNLIKHKEKIVSLDYVDEADLEYLYKNANALVFTSLCEGFGSPPLEAMRYGTRVVCSNAMSLNELYNETLLFDPYDILDIKEKILNYESIDKNKMIEIYNKIENKCQNDLKRIKDIISK